MTRAFAFLAFACFYTAAVIWWAATL
jgi:hypothetical protein